MSHWHPALFWYSRALTTSRTSVGAQPGLGVGAGMMSRINSHWALVRSVLYAFRMAAGLPFRGSGILPLPNSLRPNQPPDSLSMNLGTPDVDRVVSSAAHHLAPVIPEKPQPADRTPPPGGSHPGGSSHHVDRPRPSIPRESPRTVWDPRETWNPLSAGGKIRA